jgi:hypothetical protein
MKEVRLFMMRKNPEDVSVFEATFQKAAFGDEEARQYVCKKCGAVFVTDNHSAITVCRFCHSPATLGERISGDYAPTKIIPFSISKRAAAKAFRAWHRKLKFAPKEFTEKLRDKKVVGLYVPIWLCDLEVSGTAALSCTQAEDSAEPVVLSRQASLSLQRLPICASSKLSQKLFEKLEPFEVSRLQAFRPSFLSHFLSEKYHASLAELCSQAQKRSSALLDQKLLETAAGYKTADFVERDYTVQPSSSEYVLFPIWIVCYDTPDEDYLFVMNGQTGKIASSPPRSLPKIAISIGLLTLCFFLLCRIITVLLGGPLL